jgi:hypothetical protein
MAGRQQDPVNPRRSPWDPIQVLVFEALRQRLEVGWHLGARFTADNERHSTLPVW